MHRRTGEQTDRQTECINTFQLCWKVLKSVAEAVSVAKSLITSLFTRFQETGYVWCRPGKGHPRDTRASNDRYVRLTVRGSRRADATQILRQFLFLKAGRRVSSQTNRNRLHQGGL